ncbi:family 43 glycosylhydrolase [Clostridium sp. SHJSY1]|uniref:family 43 glycosylhydrolase n=1 Tax=Clostridium sp. SHJSY1 TaxID=2942483 RepID=UPI0028749299|nr:family 43 glycosylhydrolase [Clostridium sp. SHJSY1]MDS0527723.1 family 43 glycosylhydrolase [Clostridium sp. SHJSY1]
MIKQLLGGKSVFKMMALTFALFTCFSSTEAFASNKLIKNDTFWKDTDGNTIYSQGGGILKVDDTYYWYGVKYNGAVSYAESPISKNSNSSFYSVTCYSSKDLVNWKFENDIITKGDLNNTGHVPTWIGRLGVFYNKSTNKYVLVSQYEDGKTTGELFATSDTPNGRFTFNNIQSPVPGIANNHAGDQTVFTDDDGKSYLICCSANGRQYLYVAPFSEDGLAVEPATQIYKSNNGGREGNCMFKYNGVYYFCSSDLHGWNSSHCYYMKSKNIFGPYEEEKVMQGTEKDFSHVSQTGFFTNVTGSKGTTILFCGDRWSDFAGNGVGYNQWCPLSFDGETPVFNSVSEFKLNAEKGIWSVGRHNNYILNPCFEADRIISTNLAGWSYSSNISDSNHAINVKKSCPSGNFSMQHLYNQDYKATTYQNIVNIPNGKYKLKAWVMSSGGQNTCNIFAKDFGGEEKQYSINSNIGAWSEITIPHINVSNGKCQVGIYSDASANEWCMIDNFSFIKE